MSLPANVTPVLPYNAPDFEDVHPFWFEALRLAEPEPTAKLRGILSSYIDEIVAGNKLRLPPIRILIADDTQPLTTTIQHLDLPVIVVSRALMDFVQSKDEIIGVLAQQVAHVFIKNKADRAFNSRPEEIGADGLAAQWTFRTGYNWRALQDHYRRLAARENELGNSRISWTTSPYVRAHSSFADRIQYTATAIGMIALGEARDIPEPQLQSVSPALPILAAEVRHQTYMERLLAGLNPSPTPIERLALLNEVERTHFEGRHITISGGDMMSGDPAIQAKVRTDFIEERAQMERTIDFHDLIAKAVTDLSKIYTSQPDVEPPQALVELVARAVDQAGFYTRRNSDDKDSPGRSIDFYMKAHDALYRDRPTFAPIGTALTALNDKIAAFVNAADQDTAITAAKEMSAAINDTYVSIGISSTRESLYRGRAGYMEDTASSVYFMRRLALDGFKPTADGTLPWTRHIEWARTDDTIASMLWHLGVNKDHALWEVISYDSLFDAGRTANLTQPAGELAQWSLTPAPLLDAIRDRISFEEFHRRANETAQNIEKNRASRDDLDWAVADPETVKAFAAFAKDKIANRPWRSDLPRPQLRPGHLKEDLLAFCADEHNRRLLEPPWNRPSFGSVKQDHVAIDMGPHLARTGILFDAIENCLQAGHADDEACMRDFFITEPSQDNPFVNLEGLSSAAAPYYPWDSPALAFLDNHVDWFTQEDILKVLLTHSPCGRFMTICQDSALAEAQFAQNLPGFYAHIGMDVPGSFADLETLAQALNLSDNSDDYLEEDSLEAMTTRFFDYETNRLLDDQSLGVMTADFAVFARTLNNVHGIYKQKNVPSQRELAAKIRDRLENETPVFPTEMDIHDAIDLYRTFDALQAFPNLEFMQSLGDDLLTRIKVSDDPSERIALIESLILADENAGEAEASDEFDFADENMSGSVTLYDFGLVAVALQVWAADIVTLHGRDPGGAAYCEDCMVLILDKIQTRCPQRDRFDMYRVLADAVIAQFEVCDAISARLDEDEKAGLTVRHDLQARGMEALVEFIRRDRASREDWIDYLTSYESGPSLENVADHIMAWINEPDKNQYGGDPTYSRKYNMLSGFGLISFDIMSMGESQKDPHLGLDGDLRRHLCDTLRHTHRLYWTRPPQAQAHIVNHILLSNDDPQHDSDAQFREALDITLACLFDKTEDTDQDELRRHWVRSFLEVYLENAQDGERGLMLGQLISSAQASSHDRKKPGFGERLATLLGMMGSAYRKLAQSIHSHPDTTEDIRAPLGRTKTLNRKVPRWQHMAMLREAVPQSVRDTFAWVGEIVGDAAFFTVTPVTMKDGRSQMLGILEDEAGRKAQHGFTRIAKSATSLAHRESDFSDIADVMLAMIDQARDLVSVETNMDLGAQQSQIMQRQYEGLHVTADGHKFDFKPMAWNAYGERFKLMDVAYGHHFDDKMPESTPAEKAYKKALAKATVTTLLSHILSGDYFDHDGHGGQMKAEGSAVGVFDPGGILPILPVKGDKKTLGQAFGAILPALLDNKGGGAQTGRLFTAYLAQVKAATGKIPDHLMRVHMAMLAQGDFHRHLDSGDFREIVITLIRNRTIDPAIILPLAFTAARQNWTGGISSMLKTAFTAPSIKIERDPPQAIREPVYIPMIAGQKSMPQPAGPKQGCRGWTHKDL